MNESSNCIPGDRRYINNWKVPRTETFSFFYSGAIDITILLLFLVKSRGTLYKLSQDVAECRRRGGEAGVAGRGGRGWRSQVTDTGRCIKFFISLTLFILFWLNFFERAVIENIFQVNTVESQLSVGSVGFIETAILHTLNL